AHFDQAMALYEPAEHRPLSSRFDNMPRQPPTPNSLSLLPRKNVPVWKARGMMNQGSVLALTGRALDAIGMLTSGIAALRTTGATANMPIYLSHLARAHAELGQFEQAWRCIDEAMAAGETTKEKW